MLSLGKNYNGNKNIDIIVEAGGSGTGLEAIINNKKDIGNISRSPKISEAGSPTDSKGKFSKQWKQNKVKTITIGWDGICVIYKPSINEDTLLDLNNETISKIYEIISGYKEYRLSDIITNGNDKIMIKPFARAGGSVKSGTADAFANDSHLTNSVSEDVKQILKDGSYGNNVSTTNESNAETWKQISSNGGIEGSMTYLSSGFVINNKEEIEKNGFKIATYNSATVSIESVSKEYKWFRPLNSLINISFLNDQTKEFIQWVVSEESNEIRNNVFKSIGIIQLNKTQKQSMTNGNNDWSGFWIDDYEIIGSNITPWYGAKA